MSANRIIARLAIDSFEDLLDQLHAHPEWSDRLRAVVLTERLLQLPDIVAGLAEQVRGLAEAQRGMQAQLAALTERVDALAAAQETTEVRLQGLTEQVSKVATRADRAIGYLLELQYRSRAHAYLQRIARRLHVLTGEELDDLLEPALEAGTVSSFEAEHVRWADAVMRGRRDEGPIFLVLEVSVLVDTDDVDRAEHRARVVGRLGGAPAISIVAGEQIQPDAAGRARDHGVWLVTDGRVEAPPAA